MSFSNKLQYYCTIPISLLILAHIAGCAKEEALDSSSPSLLSLSIHTKMQSGEQVNSTPIACTRLIVIDKSTFRIIFNKSTEDGLSETSPDSQTYSLELKPGNYLTYIVANETEGMQTGLSYAATLSDLKAIRVSGEFNEANVPFSGSQEFIFRKKPNADGTVSTEVSTNGGATWGDKLQVSLLRTQSKISLYLRKKTGSTDEIKITKVELLNIPDYSYLISKAYDTTSPQSRDVFNDQTGINLITDVADGNEELTSYTTVFDTGGIFPEKMMTDNTDASQATYLKIYATYGTLNTTYMVKLRNDLAVENYDLTRNIHYKVYATLRSAGDLSAIHIAPIWTVNEVPGDVVVPYLNISELCPQFGATKDLATGVSTMNGVLTHTYYFWTNRPANEVKIAWDSLSPGNMLAEAPVITIMKNSTTPDGVPDVAGKVDIKLNSSWINTNFHLTNTPKGTTCTLETDKLSRTLQASVKGGVIPYLSNLTPTSGLIEGRYIGGGVSSAKNYYLSKTCSFEFTAFFDPRDMIAYIPNVGYAKGTLTEKSKVVGADGVTSTTYSVAVGTDNARWLTAGDHDMKIGMRSSNYPQSDLCSPIIFKLTIVRSNY